MSRDDPWRQHAACRDCSDPDSFFELEDAKDEGREPSLERLCHAIAHCAVCPVQQECEDEARSGSHVGVWGMTGTVERGLRYGPPEKKRRRRKR